ncbi:GntR family transcriptional regulator [Beijerinckia sp. L45]|uniref:GntR family transcriptional regulator n=1 Tax=Beijerinckia sp. L45 TaxID=1641855 RepID=UPI00131EBAFC|nr:GntR family transcriptional regulator [Beijerinckia sp. L45]
MPAARTRAESLRLKLEEDILARRFIPGEKLDEEALGERFGLSRTPVREALKALTSGGLVEIRPHQGAFVATLTARAIVEMVETMAVLERACAAAAARRHTLADRSTILKAQEACEAASSVADPKVFYKANVVFHETIYRSSQNAFLALQARSLRQRLEPYRRQIASHPGMIERSNVEHRRIIAAVFAMDESAADAAMTNHLTALQDTIASMIEPTPPRRVLANRRG